MIDDEDIGSDRRNFVNCAQSFWVAIKNGNSKKANAETAAGDEIVRRWVKNDKAEDLLGPLLVHETAAVRFAAAAHLINLEPTETVIEVLRSLHGGSFGLIGPAARLTLMRHGIALKSE